MADAFVCPLFAGGGTRLKLLEYLATGKPIVTTQKGAEGIPNQGQFEYAETASDFILALLRVFEMDAKSKQRRHFATRLAWQTVTQEYIRLYQRDSHVRGSNRFDDLLSRQHALGQETLHLPSYTPTKPRTLLFLINRGCNLRCSFCDLWDNPQNISLKQVGPILDDAVAIGTKIVVLTGGEPLMHPDIQAIIRMAKERGMAVNMTTNGLLLRRHWSWIRQSGIDSLSFSIDGLAEVHDLLRGQQGAYDLTMKAIQTVLDESRIPCSVYCTVTNKNVHQLADLHQMFLQMGVGFDFWPVNDAPDLYLTSEEHKTLWVQAVSKITERDLVYASRQSFYADSLRYHDGQVVDNRRCLGFVEQYGIKYNGDLLPCCVWEGDGLVVGNVFEKSLKDLWHSEKVQGVRQSMVEDGCHVPCFNHSLYEFRTAVRG
jgi:MoaA/NifB/PqqE/SkfB family radical SAM enzyme